ncbi:MAG: ABC transporter substrate-binding protein [Rhodospirillales bacterium]|jgi:branched-chain amino acid transport system substrate-binding protein|nr:ABC transporter substrate-binding protein [Rhodospirillales bacterium]
MTIDLTRRAALGGGIAAAGALGAGRARAQAKKTIRIGILTDFNGPNSASTGKGSVTGSQLAAEDFMQAHPDIKVEIRAADYQSKPDIATSIARGWIDQDGVDLISNVNNSAAALAIASLVKEKNKAALFTAPASSDLTGKACTPNHIHWTYDTWALGNSTGGAMVKAGGDTWYFIAADYAFGRALARDTASFVTGAGGKVLGTVYTPFPETTDFSSFILQAQASGAKVVGLANSGTNTTDCIKQGAEFGLRKHGIRMAALLMMIPDLHGVGLPSAQGLVLTESFYWDRNDASRAYGKRFGARMNGWMPSMIQAADYSAITHYLKTVQRIGLDHIGDGRAVIAAMKAEPSNDPLFGTCVIRADGRRLNPMYLFQVKAPAESKYPWDYYKLLRTTPADKAFRPMDKGGCPLVHS